MENASKALIIAGGVLLAMMIIAGGILLYSRFSKATETYGQTMSATKISEFNTKFEVFRGRTDVTAQEIVSLDNLIKEYKTNTTYDISINIVEDTISDTISDSIKFLKDNLTNTFTEKEIIYENGQVTKISFQKNI